MRFTTNIKTLMLFFGIAFVGYSCSDDDSPSGTSDEMATINGQVETTNSKAINASNTVVTAAEIASSGSIQTIEGTETNADASGNFTLTVDADLVQNLAVQASSGTTTTMGFVQSDVKNGNSYELKPLNTESSAETKVYAELIASAKTNMVTKAEIEAMITADNAASINASSNAAATFAASLSDGAEVRATYFESEFQNESDAKLTAVTEAMVEAQANLEGRLNAANSANAKAEAYANFQSEMIDAYADANIEATIAAKTQEMYNRAFMEASADLSADITNETNTQASLLYAAFLDMAVKAETERAGAGTATESNIDDAGVALRSSIESSSGSEAEVRAAFQTYHDDVRTALEEDATFNATALITIDTQLNSETGAKTIFESAISSSLTADQMLQVYNTYFTAVETSVSATIDGTDTKVEALTEIMILINAAS